MHINIIEQLKLFLLFLLIIYILHKKYSSSCIYIYIYTAAVIIVGTHCTRLWLLPAISVDGPPTGLSRHLFHRSAGAIITNSSKNIPKTLSTQKKLFYWFYH